MIQIPRFVRSKLTPIIRLPRRRLYYVDTNIMVIADFYSRIEEVHWIIPNRRFKLKYVGGEVVYSGLPFFDKTLIAVITALPTSQPPPNGSSPILG